MSTAAGRPQIELNAAARSASRCRAAWLARVRITDPVSGQIVPELFEAEMAKVLRGAAAGDLPAMPEPATVADVLKASESKEYRPLLKIRLGMLLRYQPGWGRIRAEGVVDHVLAVTGVKLDRRLVNVGWLLDPRAGGRRYTAWLDALEPKKNPPWQGFPHTRSSRVD
ncbi:hypothetical protein [Arthrobacter caoxuetaonis]|uniref:Uncharacterized protein n=1 Tax=Arthrobacter caoxuetaonis TaxID=2886935 RepID=A0A9X1MG10_9MICC|nr:hypothetical protein [Arthrobacter caoxuetaonis]MCC3299448.1 hypothetical protein [Arthrobacter caoxuetaonis]USQ59060.1 hypothetical protein NF551_18310 [Arthrobacter caoxuetaonis]